MKFEALIFDCDGTLVDSEELGFEVIHEQALRLGVSFLDGEALAAFRGRSMSNCLAAIESRLGYSLPSGFEAHLREEMATCFRNRLQPMPGASFVLEKLTIPFCVATNGPRSKTELTLGLTGLLRYFDGKLVSAYEVGHFKPDPRLFLAAAQLLGNTHGHW